MGQYPWAFIIFYAIVLVVAISAAWRTVVINTDLDSFRRVDADAAKHHEVYLEAQQGMRAIKNATSLADRTAFKLEVFYQASSSVLGEATLRDIRGFEHRLRALPGWQRLCGLSDPAARFRCEPGESLGNYIWPRRLDDFLGDQGFFRLAFDGSARERMPVQATLAYLVERMAAPHDPWNFLPQGFNIQQTDSLMLRSTFSFTAPSLEDADFRREYSEFVQRELYPMLCEEVEMSRREVDEDSWDQQLHVRISFRGDGVDEYELRKVLERDAKFAAGALVFTILTCWFQFCSFFLAFVATLLLSFTVLLSYITVPVPKVGLASFLAMFLLYGLGTHSLFRLHALWRRSRPHAGPVGMTQRLQHFHVDAALQLFPLVMSSLCLYVCLYALLRPLREFGLFMGAGMLFTSLLSIVVFTPILLLHEETIAALISENLPRWLALVLEPRILRPPWRAVAAGLSGAVKKPKPVLMGTAGMLFVAFIAVVAVAATRDGTGLPELFPQSHNRNVGRQLATHFVPTSLAESAAPPPGTTFCEPGRQLADCGLHWCEAPLATPAAATPSNITECSCYRTSHHPNSASCSNITVSSLFSGSNFAGLTEQERLEVLEAYMQTQWGHHGAAELAGNRSTSSARHLPSLVLEHWESGKTDIEPLVSMPLMKIDNPRAALGVSCAEEVICHCGARACQAPRGYLPAPTVVRRRLSSLPQGDPSPGVGEDRRLSTQQSGGQRSTEVVVVFGIQPPESGKFLPGDLQWSFDQSFDPLSPWAQRAMYAVCSDIPAELNVLEMRCWISGFRTWLMNRGEKFPVKRFDDFHALVRQYLVEDKMAAADMWLDDHGNIRATSLHFKVGLRSGSAEVLQDQQRWREYIALKNSQAASTASRAWATSQVWVEMEAYNEGLASAWRVCILIVLAVAFAGMVYIMDFEIVGCLVAITFVSCTFILFFMLCIFQWQFGPWQIMILVLFLSYSVEPAFHIGRDFVFPQPVAPAVRSESSMQGVLALTNEVMKTTTDQRSFPTVASSKTVGSTVAHNGDLDLHAGGGGVDTIGTLLGVSSGLERGERGIEPIMPADTSSEASSGGPHGEAPAVALERSVYLAVETLAASSVQLILCGMWLVPCEFRLFTQLGVVAIIVPLVWVPGILLLLPAALLYSGRTRREPDVWLLWRHFEQMVSNMLSVGDPEVVGGISSS